MAHLATPWKHPDTGVYYLRRQVPARLRSAFNGRTLWKVSLGTKVVAEATVLFLQANAELELRFEEARGRLKATGDPRPSRRDYAIDLVAAYFEGPTRSAGGLDGPERLLLARLETDRGLWDATPDGCSPVPPSTPEQWWHMVNNAALFRDHRGTRTPVRGLPPGSIWRMEDESFRPGARADQVARLLEQVARYHGIGVCDLPDQTGGILVTHLDKLPVEATRTRKPRSQAGRLRPDMRLLELFDEWVAKMSRSCRRPTNIAPPPRISSTSSATSRSSR